MKITVKKTDELNRVLTINVDAADYQPARKKRFKEIVRTAEIPGFRKGMVPVSLIEKRYGESVLVESVNDVLSEALKKYIEDEKLNIVGEPLPCEERKEQEWKNGNSFEFDFDIALTPEVKIDFAKSDEVPYYTISVSADDKKKMLDLYKKQQPKESKKTDEELAKEVAERLEEDYKQAAEFRFDRDVRDFCVKKAGVKVAEKFLRRWLIVANEGKFTEEQIDKDFAGFLEDYRWQLVMGELTKKFGIKIENEDVLEEAKNFARYQFSMYGMANVPEEQIESFAKSMLGDEQSVQRIVENVQNKKVVAAVKEAITVKPKKITSDKFRELNK